MADWKDPDCIWRTDRSWQDKFEEVRLERSEFNNRPVYKLRLLWRAADGKMRWSAARETSSGNVWAEFGIKAKELESLGQLLIAESKSPQPALDVTEPASASASAARSNEQQRSAPRQFRATPSDEASAGRASDTGDDGFCPF
jgi:hypothetical protein